MLTLNRKYQRRFIVHSNPEHYSVELNTCDDWVVVYNVPYTGDIKDDAAWKRDRASVASFIRLIRNHVRRYPI